MANLEFCKKHNMVAFLKKPTGSEGFQEIVYFLNESNIRYALTKNPTIYVSLIKQFWQTATVRAVDNREQQIISTVDEEAKGSGHPSKPQPSPSFAQHIHEEQILTIVSSTHQKTQTSRQALNEDIELPQTSVPIPNVPDEAVYEEWDDGVERATNNASLDAAQDSGNIIKTQSTAMPNVPLPRGIGTGGSPSCQETMGGFIAQTRSERVPTPSYDSPFPRVNTLGSNESNMSLQELTAQCTILSDRVLALETDLRQTKKVSSQEDQPKDLLGVLSAAKVLADAAKKKVNTYTRRRRAVNTGSEGVSTASRIVSAADVVQEGVKDKEQEELLASETTKDEANFLVTYVGWDDVQAQIQAYEELAQKMLKEERKSLSITERAKLLAELIDKRKKLQATQRYKVIRNKPQTMSQQRKTMCTYMKNMTGYKMEHFKGKSFYETKEGSESTEEPKANEISQEDLQQMMMIVLVEEVYVESLQVKYPIIDWERFNRDDLVRLWDLVKKRFSTTEPTDDKEKALWVELKRLFEPDNDDILWKLQMYVHDPLVWRLYDTCVESSNSVRRPKSKDTKSNNRVLKNTNGKRSSVYVQKVSSSVSIDSNKRETMNSIICQTNACVLNTKTLNSINDSSNIVCVSCDKDVFMLSYEKCVARYALSRDSRVIQFILWIVDSRCSKHMTGNLKLLRNFVEKFIGIVRFGNDHFATITRYGDYVQRNLTICHGDDLLTGSHESNLYTISISELAASSPVCLMSKATSTKSWLWHQRLFHLNFGTINQLTSKDLVDGILKFMYNKDHLCSAEPITLESSTPVLETHSDEQNQEDVAELNGNTIMRSFEIPEFEEAESSSNYQEPSNMHEFHQQHHYTDKWTNNHPINQVIGDPSKPV
nr:hypothetical protein [Tanacetum cinerariifolium]